VLDALFRPTVERVRQRRARRGLGQLAVIELLVVVALVFTVARVVERGVAGMGG
jgi:hypothetical protein